MTLGLSTRLGAPATTKPSEGRLVLVVDDEYPIVELLRELLQSAGFRVLTAMSGREATTVYAERHPDAVLLDIRLPDMNGVRALEEIRRIDPDVRVAVLTALGQHAVVRQAMEAGAAEYLLKPLDLTRVLRVVTELCA
jgi:DNA-binding NtrC family response regulator